MTEDVWEGRFTAYMEEAEKQITALRAALAEKDREIAFLMANDQTIAAAMDELRAALDQERADNERLRAFAQHIRSTPTPISRFRMNVTMRSLGLLDDQNKPTALLSGRGEITDE